MKSLVITFLMMCLSISAFADLPKNSIAVANRGDSSITIIDTSYNTVALEITQKTLGFEFEPMYVSHVSAVGVFAVGDRKNNQLLIFNDKDGKLAKKIPLAKGVFHQWVKPGDSTVCCGHRCGSWRRFS